MTGNDHGLILQDRDRTFLAELQKFRWVDREQAKRIAGFTSTTRVNTRMLALVRAGLLSRLFVGTISSGRKAVYGLSAKGAALVGLEHPPKRHKHTDTVATDLFVEHQLQLNSVVLAAQAVPDAFRTAARIDHWQTFHHAVSTDTLLIPDGLLVAKVPDGFRAMFLEVDLGTETHRVWRKKTESYLRFARSGEFERRFHFSQFRVLVVARSQVRTANIRSTISKLSDKISWFSTFEQIHRDGFWAPVWLRPTGEQVHSLL